MFLLQLLYKLHVKFFWTFKYALLLCRMDITRAAGCNLQGAPLNELKALKAGLEALNEFLEYFDSELG